MSGVPQPPSGNYQLPPSQLNPQERGRGFSAARARGMTAQPPQEVKKDAPKGPSKKMSPDEEAAYRRKLAQATDEFFLTEKSYIKGLEVLIRQFLQRCKACVQLNHQPAILTGPEVGIVFSNIEDIYQLNSKFFKEIKELKEQNKMLSGLGKTFRKFIPFFKLYTLYVKQYDKSLTTIQQLMQKRTAFKNFVEMQEFCENGLLQSFLILPVQRIPRYVLLLEQVKNLAKEDEDGVEDIVWALKEVKGVATDINTTVTHWEARSKVVAIQAKFVGTKVNLLTPGRYFIKDGPLMKVYNKPGLIKKDNEYQFFLFNDLLVYAQRLPKLDFYNYKHSIPILGMEVADIPDSDKPDGLKNAFRVKGKDSKKLLLYAATQVEKYEWLSQLMPLIEKAQKNVNTLHLAEAKAPVVTATDGTATNPTAGTSTATGSTPATTTATPVPAKSITPSAGNDKPGLDKKASTGLVTGATVTPTAAPKTVESAKRAPPPPRKVGAPAPEAATATTTESVPVQAAAAPTSPNAEEARIRQGTQAGVPFDAPPI